MHVVLVGRMYRHFRGWQLENEPTAMRVDEAELQDALEKRAVRLRVLGIDDHVCAIDHVCILHSQYSEHAAPCQTCQAGLTLRTCQNLARMRLSSAGCSNC